jgi:hypothetical protein
LSEVLRFSQLSFSTEIAHSNVRSLGGDDVFFDSWNNGYIVQSAMWNNSKIRLFGIITGWVGLDGEVVASMLAA